MPKSSRRKTKPDYEMLPISRKLDVIDSWLQKMLDRFPQKGQLSTSEIEDWHRDLTPFSVEAIDFAFEKMRLGIFFPMNGQVLDLCMAYEPPEAPNVRSNSRCDKQCKERHGKGYHWNDFYWMMGKLRMPAFVGPDGNPRKEKATEAEIQALLTECDNKRPGGAPEFRQSTEFP